MTLNQKRLIIAGLAALFLLSLVVVQFMEVARRYEELGLRAPHVSVPASSRRCVECHDESSPGIITHWGGSKHAETGVACVECHKAEQGDADGFEHYGYHVATVVTPRDCARCHEVVAEEFQKSHHSSAGDYISPRFYRSQKQ